MTEFVRYKVGDVKHWYLLTIGSRGRGKEYSKKKYLEQEKKENMTEFVRYNAWCVKYEFKASDPNTLNVYLIIKGVKLLG